MSELKKKYIVADIESSGEYPWNSSMLSLGACVVDGKFDKIFYSELKPITMKYSLEHLKIGCLSLNCLNDLRKFDEFNPQSENFNSEKVLKILKERGEDPQEAMKRFREFVINEAEGYKPFLTSAPILFDGMFITYYFSRFYVGENPFGFSGEDINGVFRGNVRDMTANVRELGLRGGCLRHNALDDAIIEAKEFYTTLVHMRHEF